MVLQFTKVNNNTARDIIIERIRPICLSLVMVHPVFESKFVALALTACHVKAAKCRFLSALFAVFRRI